MRHFAFSSVDGQSFDVERGRGFSGQVLIVLVPRGEGMCVEVLGHVVSASESLVQDVKVGKIQTDLDLAPILYTQ